MESGLESAANQGKRPAIWLDNKASKPAACSRLIEAPTAGAKQFTAAPTAMRDAVP